MQIIVLGSGIIGLTSAIRLRECGHEVSIWTKDLPLSTTSAVAAAFWLPLWVHPVSEVTRWGKQTFNVLEEQAENPASGIKMASGLALFEDHTDLPPWSNTVRDFRYATPAELPLEYQSGFSFKTPIIEMPIYLEFLLEQFEQLGGIVECHEILSLDDVWKSTDTIVNCTGLGAAKLVTDSELLPIRGQIVRISQVGINDLVFAENSQHHATYIVPRSNDCILGGTVESGSWDLQANDITANDIIERCAHLVPAIRHAKIIEHMVGLRPGRSEVRLESISISDKKTIIHNYGHGGAGVTLCWGCAEDVVSIVGSLPNGS
jgi:D-amino-acid oxidase